MSDLALLVAGIFLTVLISGPLAVVFARLRFPILATACGLLAIVSGVHWASTAPWGVGLIGAASALLGAAALILAGNKG
jgi:hypothetical protein